MSQKYISQSVGFSIWLNADRPLTEEEWDIVSTHLKQGIEKLEVLGCVGARRLSGTVIRGNRFLFAEGDIYPTKTTL